MNMEPWWNNTDRILPPYWEKKTCPNTTLFTTYHLDLPGIESLLCGEAIFIAFLKKYSAM
jgi:hypothetical protein